LRSIIDFEFYHDQLNLSGLIEWALRKRSEGRNVPWNCPTHHGQAPSRSDFDVCVLVLLAC